MKLCLIKLKIVKIFYFKRIINNILISVSGHILYNEFRIFGVCKIVNAVMKEFSISKESIKRLKNEWNKLKILYMLRDGNLENMQYFMFPAL